jgi:hypothetical protein
MLKSKAEAELAAMKFLTQNEIEVGASKNWAVQRSDELPYGWVVFWNSRAYVETRNPTARLAGNGPLVVLRNGDVHRLGTAFPLEWMLRDLEESLGIDHPPGDGPPAPSDPGGGGAE